MRNVSRKVVIKNKPTVLVSSLDTVHKNLAGKGHRHVCPTQSCRLTYEDNCSTPGVNVRCLACQGRRRTWVHTDGLASLDPRACCIDNTVQMIDTALLEKFTCAGPGPWYQCRSCKRTHGHPCTNPTLLGRAIAVANPEGTIHA